MKKCFRLLNNSFLFIIFSLLFVSKVEASATINTTLFYASGSTSIVATEAAIPLLECGGNQIGKKVGSQPYSYSKSNVKLYFASGHYVVKTLDNFDKSKVVTFTCTYDSINLEYGTVSSMNVENDGNNTLKINVTVLPASNNWEVSIVLYPKMGERNYLAMGTGAVFGPSIYKKFTNDTKHDIEFGSKGYLSVVTEDDALVITVPNADTIYDGSSITLHDSVTFKYKSGGTKYSIKYNVTLNYENSIFAKAETNLCNMSGWIKVLDNGVLNVPISPNAYSNLQDVFKKKYNSGATITLPRCSDDVANGRFFKGWNYVPGGTGETPDSQTCATMPLYNGTINLDEIRSGMSVTDSVGTLVTCQASVPRVVLNVTNSTLYSSDTGWVKDPTDTTGNTYVHYFTEPDDLSITLPKSINVASTGSSKSKFLGWAKNKNECSQDFTNLGDIVVNKADIGDGVEYSACYSYEATLEDGATPLGEEGHKTMYVGSSVSAKSSRIPEGIFSVASAYQEFIKAECDDQFNCTLTALKETGKDSNGDYIEIPVTVTGQYGDNPNFHIVYMYKVISNEGEVITLEGEEYTIEGFVASGQEIDTSCGRYEVSIDESTAKEKGVDILTIGGTTLRAHFYTVEAQCGGDTSVFQAVCLDPGREEPNLKNKAAGLDGSWYYKDNSVDPVNNYVDRMTAYLYNTRSFNINKKEDLASAEFILRLVAIITGDDKNNKSAGLREYYKAYVKIANNMKAYIKNNNKGKDLTDLSKWYEKMKKPDDMTTADYKKFFCNGSCSIPTATKHGTTGARVVAKAYKYLYNGLKYRQVKGFTPSITVHKTETKWKDSSKTQYEKIVDGKLSGLANAPEDAFLDLALICEDCKPSEGVDAKLYVGRDSAHLVNYYSKVNYLLVKYSDFKDSDWYLGKEDKEQYKDKTLLSDDGALYFQYVITATVSTVSRSANYGGSGGGDGSGNGIEGEHSVYLGVGDNYSGSLIDVGVVMPAQSINIQRMVMFSEPGAPGSGDPRISGKPGSGGGGGGSKPQETYLSPTSQVTIQYNPPEGGGGGGTIRLVYRTIRVSSVYPSCDFEIPQYQYGSGSFNKDMFRMAGCCAFVLNESSPLYKEACSSNCAYSSFSSVCKPGTGTGGSVVATEKLVINEGVDINGDPHMTCVYENPKHDSAGNTFEIEGYEDNHYCSIYCKEDWEFKLPEYSNHIGKNALKAGQYFEIKHEQIAAKGTRTCVTSEIKISKWKSDLYSWSKQLVGAFNCLIKTGAGPAIVAKKDFDNPAITFEGDAGQYTVTVVGASACPKTKHTDDKYVDVTGPKVKKEGDTTCYESWKEKESHSGSVNSSGGCDKGSKGSDGKCHWSTTSELKEDKKVAATKCKYKFSTTGSYDVTYMTWNGHIGFGGATATGDYTTEEVELAGPCDPNKVPTTKILEEIKTESINAATSSAGCDPGDMGSLKKQIKNAIREMHRCQKFEVVAEGKQGRKTSGNYVIKDTDIALSIVDIMTVFDPKINFSYDDTSYMSKIGSYNELKKDDSSIKWTEGYAMYSKEGFNKETYEGSATHHSSSGQGIGEENDDSYAFAHCTLGGSGTGVSGGSKGNKESSGSKSGHVYHWSAEPDCYERHAPYIDDAEYIKRYIGFKADYIKERSWYSDRLSDYKEYATSPENAVSITSSNNKNPDLWSRLGTDDNYDLVFPVSSDTPRGLYKYQFIYSNVGMYNNTGLVGRIMGGANSVVPNNKRTCFYEVVEEICTCCGDVDTYILQTQENEEIIEEADPCSGASGKCELEDFFGDGEYAIDIDAVRECKGNAECIKKKTGGLAASNIIVSPVALGTIKKNIANTGRNIGVNWTKKSQYILDGELYITDKGAGLLDKLDSNAEKIYNTPEYSYTLSPSALGSIRELNSTTGYQPRTETFTSVPKRGVRVNSDGSSWIVGDKEDTVSFTHLKSTFLSGFMKQYTTIDEATGNPLKVIDTDDVCYVLAEDYNGDVGGVNGFNKVYKTSTSAPMKYYTNSGGYNCRWIDYVGKTKRNDRKSLPEGIKENYRLPFK